MVSSRSGVPLHVLREAARLRVAAIGLRPASREMGLSWSGLRTFLGGTRPHSATLLKLSEWYDRLLHVPEAQLPVETARVLLALLVQHVPPARRVRVADAILGLLRQEAEETGTALPAWVGALLSL